MRRADERYGIVADERDAGGELTQLLRCARGGDGDLFQPVGGRRGDREKLCAQCAEHAGVGRHKHRVAAKQLGQRVGMERAGTAESDEPELAWIETALHGDDAERAEHHLIGDVDDALRRLFRR